MGDVDPAVILSALADRHRIQLLTFVLQHDGPCSTETAVAFVAAPVKQSRRHLQRLLAAGLLVNTDGVLTADLEPIRIAGEAAAGAPAQNIPRAPAARRAFLEELQRGFEPGRDYTEPQVNSMLAETHDDHAALRRYMVDDGLLARSDDGARYWLPVPPIGERAATPQPTG